MSKIIIPDAALQQHIAVLGKNGSGKTYATKAVIVEPLLAADKHVALVDPTSAWWGLRSSADGKGPGFKVIVLGGDHGDLPLPALGGAAVARLVIEQRVNVVIDTGNLTVGERTRWMIDFAGTVYRLNRQPLYLVLDEAHVFAPQGKVPDPDTGKMLHAVNQLASGGRSRGIRLTMITQRPQKLHKDALTTADTLIAMRVLAPHDREAVKAWIDGCGDPAQGKQVLDSLAGLQRGEGWVWYPEGAHLVRAKFPAIKTFDSSATPTEGGHLKAPKGAAEIDLTEIKAALADAVKDAEENDPKLLKHRIAELEKVAGKPRELAVDNQLLKNYRDEGYRDGVAAGYEQARSENAEQISTMLAATNMLRLAVDSIGPEIIVLEAQIEQLRDQAPASMPGRSYSKNIPTPVKHKVQVQTSENYDKPSRKSVPATGDSTLAKAERLILTALAQYETGRTKKQVAILTGYAVNGGGFGNAIGSARAKGFLEGNSERLTITDSGIAALGEFTPLPQGAALLQHWYGQLGKAERACLEALACSYPRPLSKEELAEIAGYQASGGGFGNALGRLRTLELITGFGELRASEDLFG